MPKILKADTESLLYFEKNIIIGLYESSKNLQRIFKKEGQLLYFAQAFFGPRNIKTQFSGNFNNLRLKKFPSNCVLMFLGLKKAWAQYKSCPYFSHPRFDLSRFQTDRRNIHYSLLADFYYLS